MGKQVAIVHVSYTSGAIGKFVYRILIVNNIWISLVDNCVTQICMLMHHCLVLYLGYN